MTPMKAALYLAGFAVGAFFGSGVGAWATTAVGRPILHVGLAIMAVGTAVLYASMRAAATSAGSSWCRAWSSTDSGWA